jgi:DNA-binding MarR family transcriptional regulator
MTTMRRTFTNITPRQMEILSYLSTREQWLVGEIAAALGVSSAAATKAIARLERKGLVTRSVDIVDRRCVNVRITRAGGDAVRQILRPI